MMLRPVAQASSLLCLTAASDGFTKWDRAGQQIYLEHVIYAVLEHDFETATHTGRWANKAKSGSLRQEEDSYFPSLIATNSDRGGFGAVGPRDRSVELSAGDEG